MGIGAAFCGVIVYAAFSEKAGRALIKLGLLAALVGFAGTTVGL